MLTGVITFLLLFVVLLAIPLRLTFQASWQHSFDGYIELQWAFGLVRTQLSFPASKSTFPKVEKPVRKSSRSERSSGRNIISVFRQKTFRRRVARFISDLWNAVHKRDIRLQIRVGLGDPADTGQLWAIVGPVAGMLSSVKGASIAIEPEFQNSVFELDSSGNIRIIPLNIVSLVLGMVLSPAVWKGIKQMRKAEL